jgi:hypothetical protein
MKKLAVALGLLGLLSLASAGCHPRMVGPLVAAAIVTAAIVGSVRVLEHHDGHYHHASCGHHRRYHEGHWVYHYNGQWEYHDPYESRWYYYAE